jgi:signal transduction histidine kinase
MPELLHVLLVADESTGEPVEMALTGRETAAVECDTVASDGSVFSSLDATVDVVLAVHDPPAVDGVAVVEDVVARHGSPPVVVLGGAVPVERALESGAADCLSPEVLDCPSLLDRRLRTVAAARGAAADRHVRRAVDEVFPGVVYRCRNERGWPMTFLSEGSRRLTGHPARELLDGEVSWGRDLVHPDDREWVRETVQNALEAGERFQLTYRIRTAGDGQRWVWERGGETDDGLLEGVMTDVTPYREREERIEGLLDATRVLMRRETREEIVTAAVEAARDVLGLPLSGVHLEDGGALVPVATTTELEELLGREPTYHPADETAAEPGDGLVLEAFEHGETVVVPDTDEYERIRDRDTPSRSVIVHPLGDHGVFITSSPEPDAFDEVDVSLASLLATTLEAALDRAERERDLRERQHLFERQNERLEEFASVVSHDLRNPLNVAQGNLDLVRESGDLERLDAVSDAHDRMEQLISDLLALARQGRYVGDPSPTDLATAARSAWATVETDEATLELADLDPILADRERLVSLLENLFRNAVEHGSTSSRPEADDAVEHAGPVVTVTVGELEDGFYVADDGPGVPESDRETVFDRGYTTTDGGTGFGLAIVRDIAQAHDWAVTLTESASGGARFEFTGVDQPGGV